MLKFKIFRNIALVLYVGLLTVVSYPERIYNKIKYGNSKERYDRNYKKLRKISKNIVKIIGLKIECIGDISVLEQEIPALLVGNHRSNLDSILLISLIEQPLVFIGKGEIKKMPIIGRWFVDIGAMFIQRDDIKESMKVIIEGIDRLKKGTSVVIFPEGGRTKEKIVRPFKSGSFKLALKSDVNIIPFVFCNTEEAFESKKYFNSVEVKFCVSEVIDFKERNLLKSVDLAKYATDVVSDMYKKNIEEE